MDDINFGKLGKSKIIHIVKNDAICKKTKNKYINISQNNLHSTNKLCKICNKKFKYEEIIINNNIYYKLNNIIYTSNNILKNSIFAIIEDNTIKLTDYNLVIDLISLNKKRYYLINNLLYDITNKDIFNNILTNSIGKILGPKLAILYTKENNIKKKNMVVIEKLKFNLWDFLDKIF
jgi:hypothetical protein